MILIDVQKFMKKKPQRKSGINSTLIMKRILRMKYIIGMHSIVHLCFISIYRFDPAIKLPYFI